jgi:mono/diheme cytochrome c family protein
MGARRGHQWLAPSRADTCGHLRTDTQFFTGRNPQSARELAVPATLVTAGAGGGLAVTTLMAAQQLADENSGVDTFPFPITERVLRHGRNRYMIYCAVCHDALGTGHGTIVERGYTPPPSYHRDRLRTAPVGHFFQVVTRGYGSMPAYGNQIPPHDRWAIIAYIRALQLSQRFPEKDLPDDLRREWRDKKNTPTTGRQP